MAISFHEGLPGAGKSYEACVFHILPALKKHRKVITNIRGVNHQKFAELLDEPVELIELLLIYVEPAEQDGPTEDVQRCINAFADNTPDNALIVWDEIQDYFPSGNYKLPLNQQKFWTEHRHRGLDIVIMGQDRDDVHKIIRSRIRDVVYFLKLEAVGLDNRYKWAIFQKQEKGKFIKTGSGVRKYDSKYFGLYMSHRREGVKAGVYTTKRTNLITNSKMLIIGPPLMIAALIWAFFNLKAFFYGEKTDVQTAQRAVSEPVQVESTTQVENYDGLVNPPPAAAEPVADVVAATPDKQPPAPINAAADKYFESMAAAYRLRLMATIAWDREGGDSGAIVELLDSSLHVKERFSEVEIEALGWDVEHHGYGVTITRGDVSYIARPWPIDPFGKVDSKRTQALGAGPQAEGRTGAERASSVESGTRVVHIPDSTYSSRPWR